MLLKPPNFPLSREAFSAALRTGHGRVMQQIDSHGSDGLEDVIVGACVFCHTYDPQCEADRAPWLFSAIDRANLHVVATHAIEAATQEPSRENERDMEQRCAILRELAVAGSADAG